MKKVVYRYRRGFTLVELLVVIGIMAILLTVATPMFNGLTRSAGMKGATMQLRTTLSLARQWAITHRQITCVVFPANPSIEPDKGTGVLSRVKRAYNVYAVTGVSNNVYQGEFVRDWSFLPEGVYFDDRPAGDNILKWSGSGYTPITINYPSNTAKNAIAAISFKPDGSSVGLADMTRRPQVYLTEGYKDETGIVQYKEGMTNILEVSSMAGQVRVIQQ